MLSRRTRAATTALAWLGLATVAAAIETQDPADAQMFTQAMCVVSVSQEAKFVSLMDPDTEDPNAAAAIAFKVLPEIAPGDLVRLTPNTESGATDPTVKVEKRAAESCKRFLPSSGR